MWASWSYERGCDWDRGRDEDGDDGDEMGASFGIGEGGSAYELGVLGVGEDGSGGLRSVVKHERVGEVDAGILVTV
jgi:hypothetical protein